MSAAPPLVCPSCALPHQVDERFCAACGMPLVYAGPAMAGGRAGPAAAAARERARKIKPHLTDGPLVAVACARHQAEAELIQSLLLEEGVPSTLRRTAGFDVPDFLAAGPRDVLVPQAGAEVAREALLAAAIPPARGVVPGPRPSRLAAALVAGLGAVALVAWLGTLLVR